MWISIHYIYIYIFIYIYIYIYIYNIYIYSEDRIPTKFDLCHHFIYKLYYIIKYVGDLNIKR